MKEPVEWDSGSKTVYIGKTLTYPLKGGASVPKEAAAPAYESDLAVLAGMEPSLDTGYSKSDVLVMYDFEIQNFRYAGGVIVYPLNFKGSTYLPIRAISSLMDEPITWGGVEKKICIGDGKEEPEEEKPEVVTDSVMEQFKDLYESEEALCYEASASPA